MDNIRFYPEVNNKKICISFLIAILILILLSYFAVIIVAQFVYMGIIMFINVLRAKRVLESFSSSLYSKHFITMFLLLAVLLLISPPSVAECSKGSLGGLAPVIETLIQKQHIPFPKISKSLLMDSPHYLELYERAEKDFGPKLDFKCAENFVDYNRREGNFNIVRDLNAFKDPKFSAGINACAVGRGVELQLIPHKLLSSHYMPKIDMFFDGAGSNLKVLGSVSSINSR
jgi:hypothetical protein